MIAQKHIAKVVGLIEKWKNRGEKLVIGIDGYSGVGKTTLLKGISDQLAGVLAVNKDDFNISHDDFIEKFNNSQNKAKTMGYGVIDTEELRSFIEKYKISNDVYKCYVRDEITGKKDVLRKYDFSQPILIMEGIFLFHPKQIDDLFDIRIFLDADQEKADQRRREREQKRWGDEYYPDTHPDSYFRLLKIAFNDYLQKYQPAARADLVLKVD